MLSMAIQLLDLVILSFNSMAVQYRSGQFIKILEKASKKLATEIINNHKTQLFDLNTFKVAIYEDESNQKNENKVRFT